MGTNHFPSIPKETVKSARAIYGSTNFYLVTGDNANRLFAGLSLDNLNGNHRASTQAINMQFLITIFQYQESLPDHSVADALRERIDWKYALHLPLKNVGLGAVSLCEFRQWLLLESDHLSILQTLLTRITEISNSSGLHSSFPQSRQLVNNVCQVNRLATMWETITQTLEVLATYQPEWLLEISLPHWYQRYNNQSWIDCVNAIDLDPQIFAESVGIDGIHILEAIEKDGKKELASLREVGLLREVWRNQFEFQEEKLSWREGTCTGCLLPVSFLE